MISSPSSSFSHSACSSSLVSCSLHLFYSMHLSSACLPFRSLHLSVCLHASLRIRTPFWFSLPLPGSHGILLHLSLHLSTSVCPSLPLCVFVRLFLPMCLFGSRMVFACLSMCRYALGVLPCYYILHSSSFLTTFTHCHVFPSSSVHASPPSPSHLFIHVSLSLLFSDSLHVSPSSSHHLSSLHVFLSVCSSLCLFSPVFLCFVWSLPPSFPFRSCSSTLCVLSS